MGRVLPAAVLAVLLFACGGPGGVADGGAGGGVAGSGGGSSATGGGVAGTGGGAATGGGAGGSGGSGGGSTSSDAGPPVWFPLPSLPSPRQETGVAALGNEIFVVGGFNGQGSMVPTVEAYDPVSSSWRDAGSLPIPLHHANVAAVNGKLYVVGALGNAFAALRVVYEYDPATRQWSSKTQLPAGTERGGGSVGVAGGNIYLAGGFRQGNAVADFSRYDPVADQHVALTALPAARDHLMGAMVGDLFFAIGGRRGGIAALDGRVDRFDVSRPDAGWSMAAPMLTARGGCSAGVSGTRIIVAGGEGNRSGPASNVFPHVEVFDTVANTWSDAGVMRTPRHGTGGAVLNGVFYVPGGATIEGFGATDLVEAIPFP